MKITTLTEYSPETATRIRELLIQLSRSGKDRGETGKVLAVSPKEGKVIVEGLNMVKKHVKPRRQGETGGIVDAEGAIYASKVMPVCPKCGKAIKNSKFSYMCSECDFKCSKEILSAKISESDLKTILEEQSSWLKWLQLYSPLDQLSATVNLNSPSM